MHQNAPKRVLNLKKFRGYTPDPLPLRAVRQTSRKSREVREGMRKGKMEEGEEEKRREGQKWIDLCPP